MDEAPEEVSFRERRYLPHYERRDALYFITFRLAGALPRHAIDQANEERRILERRLALATDSVRQQEIAQLDIALGSRIEKYLDAGYGACHLRLPQIAEIVEGALAHFEGSRYQLFCWCILPNHVHVVTRPVAGYSLSRNVHSWKSFTAKEANRILGTSGAFWQREYYDRVIRNEEHLRRDVQYVIDNPAKAGLANWRWVYISERIEALVANSEDRQAGAGETPAVQ